MLSPRVKMILKIIGFVAVSLFIGLSLYLLMFQRRPKIQVIEPGDGTEISGGLTSADIISDRETEKDDEQSDALNPADELKPGELATATLTSSRIITPTLTTANTIAFYDPNDGGFYTIDAAGNIEMLLNERFPQAETISFSTGAQKAAVEFPDGSNIVLDFSTGLQHTLPSHWTEFSFSPDSDSIAVKSMSSVANNDQLVITNSDGSVAQSITRLGNNASKVTTTWSPNNNIVAFSETGSAQSAFGRQEIYLLDESGDAISAIIVEGHNFEAIWSPESSHIVYSVADAGNNNIPALWYTDTKGQSRRNLNLATWVEKCTFKDGAMLVCAVPQTVGMGSGYSHELVTASDDVYQVNVNTGKQSYIGTPIFDTQMFNLHISTDGSLLFYTDKAGRLNSLPL